MVVGQARGGLAEEIAGYGKIHPGNHHRGAAWRDAFRIARNFAWADARSDERKGAFDVSVKSLGMRLLVEKKAAGKIRKRLVDAGALGFVAPHKIGVHAAIYRWLPCDQPTLAAIRNDLDGYAPAENSPCLT